MINHDRFSVVLSQKDAKKQAQMQIVREDFEKVDLMWSLKTNYKSRKTSLAITLPSLNFMQLIGALKSLSHNPDVCARVPYNMISGIAMALLKYSIIVPPLRL